MTDAARLARILQAHGIRKDGVARKQERRPASANTYNRNGVMSMEQAMKLWLEQFTAAVRQTFGARVEAIGIQGSHGRGEAAEQSDIDVVVILDTLSYHDLKAYDDAISNRRAAR